MRALIAATALLLGGCYSSCPPPDGPNWRDAYRAEYEATIRAYEEFGHEFQGAPWELLSVTRSETIVCGGRNDAIGCHSGGACPVIQLSARAKTRTIVHEFLHFVIQAHGETSPRHELDWPDFRRVEARATEIAEGAASGAAVDVAELPREPAAALEVPN